MDPCPHCGGLAFSKLGEYWICMKDGCNKLLHHTHPAERAEEDRRKTKSYKKKMIILAQLAE